MKLCVFVLHLLRAEKRRANAHNLLEECGLPGGIWPAVDGGAMSSDDLEKSVDLGLFGPSYPFPLRVGEIGCFLSHRQIWGEMQMRDIDAAFIIEDDAGLDLDLFGQALDLAKANVRELGYIQFQTRPARSKAKLLDTNGPCQLLLPEIGGLRTTAQLVTREAAAHLLDRSNRFDRPVDTFVQSHWHTGLRPAMILPSGVLEIADQLDGSTIQSSKKSTTERLRREWHRGRYRRSVARYSRESEAPTTRMLSK